MSQAAGIRAGRAYVELGTNDSKLKAGLESVQRRLGAFGASLTKIGGGLIGAGAGLAAPLLAAANHFASSGDELSKAADRTGASVESLSELRHAASQSAVEFGKLTSAMNKQQRGLAEAKAGSKGAREAYAGLGLSIDKLLALSPDQQFEAISEKISKIEDPAKRTAAAMDIFGKSGADLLPLMIGGASGISALRKEARDLGLQVSGKDAAAATLLGDTWANVKATLMGMVFQVGAALAPMLIDITTRVVSLVSMASQWVAQNRELVVWIASLAGGLVAAGTVLVVFGTGMMGAAAAIGAVLSVAGTLATIFTAILSPIGVLVGLVVGLGAAFFYFTDAGSQTISWFSTEFQKLTQIVTETVGGMYAALTAGNLGLAAEIAFTGVKLAIATVMESVLALFGTNIDSMMQMLASVLKRIGEVISRINVGRQEAVNWLSEMIGSAFLDEHAQEMLRQDNATRSQQANQTAEEWANWDSGTAAEGWAKEFNSDELKKKLDELNNTAKEELKQVEARELELRAAAQAAFELPQVDTNQIKTGMDQTRSTFSTFNGALLAMNSGAGSIPEKQLTVQRQMLEETKNLNTNVKRINVGGTATT